MVKPPAAHSHMTASFFIARDHLQTCVLSRIRDMMLDFGVVDCRCNMAIGCDGQLKFVLWLICIVVDRHFMP